MIKVFILVKTDTFQEGGSIVSNRKGVMSEELKYNIAREMGVEKTVSTQGWGAVSAKDCGNMVTKAIEMASRNTSSQQKTMR